MLDLEVVCDSCLWRHFGSFVGNFEHISHFCSSVSIVNFEQVNAGWECLQLNMKLVNVSINA